jgi:hypothetical protein
VRDERTGRERRDADKMRTDTEGLAARPATHE